MENSVKNLVINNYNLYNQGLVYDKKNRKVRTFVVQEYHETELQIKVPKINYFISELGHFLKFLGLVPLNF